SHQRGAHAFRGGADFLYNDDVITYPRSIRGAYTFAGMANFLAGVYNSAGYTQTFGETTIAQKNPTVGVYAQDEWKVNPSLTLKGGGGHDLQFLQEINTDMNNLSPRVGFAWAPDAARRT